VFTVSHNMFRPTVLTEIYHGFPQPIQVNVGVELRLDYGLLSRSSLVIHKRHLEAERKVIPGLNHSMKTGGRLEVQLHRRYDMEMSGQLQAPASLPPGNYPLDGRLGRPQSRSGRYGEEKNPLPLLGIEP
jgi:hypothetical protein